MHHYVITHFSMKAIPRMAEPVQFAGENPAAALAAYQAKRGSRGEFHYFAEITPDGLGPVHYGLRTTVGVWRIAEVKNQATATRYFSRREAA